MLKLLYLRYVLALLLLGVSRPASAAPTAESEADPSLRVSATSRHGPSSHSFPSHQFQWAPHAAHDYQLGINFGIGQLVLGGFNCTVELRYKRLWLAYQHGAHLTLNKASKVGLAHVLLHKDERAWHTHIYLPYSTGFGLGFAVIDELWLGVEFTASSFEVHTPSSATANYKTYSIGALLGYRLFVWRGLHLNALLHYWPTIASSLHNDRVALTGAPGAVVHHAHNFNLYPNLALGYAFDM